MNKFKISQIIEQFAPAELAETWDCSGWIVNNQKKTDVKKILICLSICDNTVNQARENGCDMIVSHHPLFFVPLEYSDIEMYCAHTNMDNTNGGTTDTIIKTLGLNSENRVVSGDFSVIEFANKLKNISPNLRYVNNLNVDKIKKIGFCAGSGADYIDEVDCDAFVTGDLKYHLALDSKKVLFDIGHFESEILIKNVFNDLLKKEIEVVIADEKSPFINI